MAQILSYHLSRTCPVWPRHGDAARLHELVRRHHPRSQGMLDRLGPVLTAGFQAPPGDGHEPLSSDVEAVLMGNVSPDRAVQAWRVIDAWWRALAVRVDIIEGDVLPAHIPVQAPIPLLPGMALGIQKGSKTAAPEPFSRRDRYDTMLIMMP